MVKNLFLGGWFRNARDICLMGGLFASSNEWCVNEREYSNQQCKFVVRPGWATQWITVLLDCPKPEHLQSWNTKLKLTWCHCGGRRRGSFGGHAPTHSSGCTSRSSWGKVARSVRKPVDIQSTGEACVRRFTSHMLNSRTLQIETWMLKSMVKSSLQGSPEKCLMPYNKKRQVSLMTI